MMAFAWLPWAVGLVVVAIIVWLLLLDGALVIFPPRSHWKRKKKVFCLGLSRTGTTSISVALHTLGYHVHHFCPYLARFARDGSLYVDKRYADAFDAQTDIAPALVYRELARLYPDARFVLTTRPRDKWGAAMVRFCAKHRRMFQTLPFPDTDRYFTAMYGAWATMTAPEWARVYDRHCAEVSAFFAKEGKGRLLQLAVTQGEGYNELVPFLDRHDGDRDGGGRPGRNDGARFTTGGGTQRVPFPHVDVFHLSAVLQPKWQLCSLAARMLPAALLPRALQHP